MDESWQLTGIALNGEASDQAFRDGGWLFIALRSGSHEVLLRGEARGQAMKVPFPREPHNVAVEAPGWEVFGLVDGRVPGGALQLQRRQAAAQTNLAPAPVAPFVMVQRRLDLDFDWRLRTTVQRVAPLQGGLSAQVPLLPGERVLSEAAEITAGADGVRYITVSLGPHAESFSWTSRLDFHAADAAGAADSSQAANAAGAAGASQAANAAGTAGAEATLELQASESPYFAEFWQASASPRWHLSHSGLPPVKTEDASLLWRPWPGERLSLKATRPLPVPGPTTTLESALLEMRPGLRAADLSLELKIVTSLGGDFLVQLPPDAQLEAVQLNGADVAMQRQGTAVTLPLGPGSQEASIRWQAPDGVALVTRTPQVSLASPASNIELRLHLPRSRWPLLLTGPALGPATLYWGLLIVILGAALALGRIIKARGLDIPVNAWQWALLALGMSAINALGSLFVVAWFFALEARGRLPLTKARWKFNLMQLGLALLTIIAFANLFATIPQSLVSTPDMQVAGNASGNYYYQWYQDRSAAALPQGQVLSLPIWVYRTAMLAWSLWLVFALLRWAPWGWAAYSREALWRGRGKR